MRRVSVVGAPGSGKTTIGRRLAARLDVPFIELDAIYHQPGWTELPRDEFRARVSELAAVDGWVVDGNYSVVQDLGMPRRWFRTRRRGRRGARFVVRSRP
jgi:adenylate kinase family enzyme